MDFKQFIHPILPNVEAKTFIRSNNGSANPALNVLANNNGNESREPPRSPLSKSSYRKSLCFNRLEEINGFQKRKRVNCLKEQMNNVIPSSTSAKKQNQQLFLFSPEKDGKSSALFSPLSSTVAQYNPNSISSYFDIMDPSSSSPSSLAVVTGFPPTPSMGQSATTLLSIVSPLTGTGTTDLSLLEALEKERKEENLEDYHSLLSSLECLCHDLIDSCDEMKLSPSKGTLKPFDPIHYHNVKANSNHAAATTRRRKERKERRNPADREDDDEDDEEEDEEDRRRYSITTPKIRYASSKKRKDYFSADRLQRRKKFQERRQRRGEEEAEAVDLEEENDEEDDDGYDTNDDENDDRCYGEEEKKGNHHQLLSSPATSPSTTSLLKRTSLNPLPFLSEEIFWELRIPKSSLSIMDSKIFFFHQILWRLTFGVNNTSDSYYYFFISPAEKLKGFLSLKIDFNLYPSSNEANLASLTSPSSLDGGYGVCGGGRTKLSSGLSSLTSHSMMTSSSPSTGGGGAAGGVLSSPTKKGVSGSSSVAGVPYSRKSSQNFTFPVEFTVSRGYERFISKDELKHYLDDRCSSSSSSSASTAFPQSAAQFFSTQRHHPHHRLTQPLSPGNNASTGFYYLKLSVVISTNVGPNGELIGCVNL
jgi:hypothetical protein